jgi:hypothetical protein
MVHNYLVQHNTAEVATSIESELSTALKRAQGEILDVFVLVRTITAWLGEVSAEGSQREPLDIVKGPPQSYDDRRELAYKLRQELTTQVVQQGRPQ